jgi:chemotaxis protein CheC
MNELTELEEDALIEIFNIGIGRSANVLNQLANEPVSIDIPKLHLVRSQEAITKLLKIRQEPVSAVKQAFSGDFSGQAILLFNQEDGLKLVQRLLQDSVPLDSLSELEQDSLCEIGNIILNACFGTVINFLKADISIEMPEFRQGRINDIYDSAEQNDWSLFLEVRFTLPSESIEGSVAIVMGVKSLTVFRDSVQALVDGVTAA